MTRIDPHHPVWGLVPAGGRGERFGSEVPKQLVPIAGRPLLTWTLDRLLSSGLTGLTVALPEDELGSATDIFPEDPRVHWVAGGPSRQLSVAACLGATPSGFSLVLVHDGARPAVAVADILATIDAVGDGDGAILGRPVADTLKQTREGRVLATVERDDLFRAETPQVFRREVLERALHQAEVDGFVGTDEASIVERLAGVSIRAVMATRPNPKLTESQDFAWVSRLLEQKGAS